MGNVGTRVCLPALEAEGSILAGGSPYSALPAPNNDDAAILKVHKREKFFGSDFEFFTIL